MALFQKSKPEAPPKKHKSMQEIVHERILTAEGWHRRMASKTKKSK
jgi:hypothetical protein